MSPEGEIEELRAKVAALTTIVESKTADGDKEFLIGILSKLGSLRQSLVSADAEYKRLQERCTQLEARNTELETILEKRDYQITHLSRNLRELMK